MGTLAMAVLVGISLAYWLAVWWSLQRFFGRPPHNRSQSPIPDPKDPRPETFPPVSILKPVKGLGPDSYENFASFCQQQYPQFELIFGVATPDDPATAAIRRLQREFPQHEIQLVVAPPRGLNPKSSTLQELVARSRHPVLVISDGDIRVGPEYLSRVAPPLEDPEIGVVTCLYRSPPLPPQRGAGYQPADCRAGFGPAHTESRPSSEVAHGAELRGFQLAPGEAPAIWRTAPRLAATLEALYLECDFLPSVILAHRLFGVCVGLGATLAVRRKDLDRAGGYAVIADFLTDDYHLAVRIARLGLRTQLSHYIVDHIMEDDGLRDQWVREVRWARGLRTGGRWQYAGLPLKFSTPLATALVFLNPGWTPAYPLLAAALLLRWTVACCMLRRLGRGAGWRALAWLPLRDWLTALVWCAGLMGRSIRWRAQDFSLRPDGRLEPAAQSRGGRSQFAGHRPRAMVGENGIGPFLRRLAVAAIRHLDRLLRRYYRIREYSPDQRCLCRIALLQSDQDMCLPDGTRIAPGATIGELHFWNEHIPPVGASEPDLKWAGQLHREAVFSFELLAARILSDPQLQQVRAWRATMALSGPRQERVSTRILTRLGFQSAGPVLPWTFRKRFHDWGEDLLVAALLWAFNPAGLRKRGLRRLRFRYWMPQAVLMERYATGRDLMPPSATLRGVAERVAEQSLVGAR